MIENVLSYDILPNTPPEAYLAWAKKAIGVILQQPGLIEFRAYRGIAGSPQVNVVSAWQSLADYEKFWEGPWQPLDAEMRNLVTHIQTQLWGSSPVVPQPLRPAK